MHVGDFSRKVFGSLEGILGMRWIEVKVLHYFFLIGNTGKKNAGLDDHKTVEK